MPKKTFFLITLLVVLTFQAWRIIEDSGYLIEIHPIDYGRCEQLHGPSGSEDINIDARHQVAFISSGNGRQVFKSYRNGQTTAVENGDIWLLDLSLADSQPQPLRVDANGPFFPHGIDLIYLENGLRELYVVNHPARDQHEILIFSVNRDHNLTLKKRIRYPELISPNDIKAISSNQFFVTNDHGSPQSSFMARVEEYLGLARSSVTYFDGESGSYLLKGIKSANGITLSSDQQTLYVAEALGRSIKRYSRGGSIREWRFVDKLSVDTAVDNLEWSDSGKLLAGAHPKLFDFLGHANNPANKSPSQVININVTTTPMTFNTLYLNDGTELSGSSVAAMLNGEMLVGSVFENHLLRCSPETL